MLSMSESVAERLIAVALYLHDDIIRIAVEFEARIAKCA